MKYTANYRSPEDWLEGMRVDFKVFLEYLWDQLGLPSPTDVQYDIADWLQSGEDRIGVMAFRGVGKSWITSAFAMWSLWKNPNERILVLSATGNRAYDFGTFCFNLIEKIPLLRPLAPKEGQRASKIAFDVGPSDIHHAASMRSVGITGQITGGRATLIIADDLETPDNSLTESSRERIITLSNEFESILVPDQRSRVVFLGTPQCQESIYRRKMEMNYSFRIWPAEYPEDITPYIDPKDETKSLLAPMILERCSRLHGLPTDPERFSESDLMSRKAGYTPAEYKLQFMLDTKLADLNKFLLRTRDLILCDLEPDRVPIDIHYGGDIDKSIPNVGISGDHFRTARFTSGEMVRYQRIVMSIDPSGRGADETAYAVVAEHHGRLYVLSTGGYSDGYGEGTLEALAGIAERYKVNEVVIEANFGDGMFTSIFKPVLLKRHKATITEVKNSQQKERRIVDTIYPILTQHRLVVGRDVIHQDIQRASDKRSWIYQMTHITSDRGCLKHDDRLDALAIAVGSHREALERSEEKALGQYKDREIAEYVKRFKKNNSLRYQEIMQEISPKKVRGRGRKR